MRLSRRNSGKARSVDYDTAEARGEDRYGCKGGTSATAGRRSKTFEAVIDGKPYRKRVFFEQRFLVVTDLNGKELVTAFKTEAEAIKQRDYSRRDGNKSEYAEGVEV